MTRPVALITGATRRVGLVIARRLAAEGCDLIITSRSCLSAAHAAGIEHEIRESAPRCVITVAQCELDDPASVCDLAAFVASASPRLDILVHNASNYFPTPIQTLTADQAMTLYRVNALAPLLLSSRLAPFLSRSSLQGGGAIVAMADMHALGRPRKSLAAYSMAKAALIEMVRGLARELAPRVRVNAVAPGVVAFPDSGPDADPLAQSQYLARVPLGRAGTPDDAADAVAFLALRAAYTTGEIVRVDGGRWLA